jgi:hypothetical protein
VNYWNYLQIHGVRGGVNTMTVSLQDLSGKCFRAIRLGSGTGVYATTANPLELGLLVPHQTLKATKGHALTIPFKVTRRGGWSDKGATVVLDLPRGWLALTGTTKEFARVGAGLSGSFRIVPTSIGLQSLRLSVAKDYNQPSASVEVDVRQGQGWFSKVFRTPILLSACFIVLAGALTRTGWRDLRRHRGARSNPAS